MLHLNGLKIWQNRRETFKNVLSTDQGTDICKRRSSLEDRRLFYKDYFRFCCHDLIKKVVGLSLIK